MKKVLISMVMACAAMSMMAQQKPAIPYQIPPHPRLMPGMSAIVTLDGK